MIFRYSETVIPKEGDLLLGKRIKKYILEQGFKIGIIAQKSSFSFQTFSAMLNGKRKIMAEDYFRICKVLNVPLEKFTE